MATSAKLSEQSFPLQLAPELLEGALYAVTLVELNVCHDVLREDEAPAMREPSRGEAWWREEAATNRKGADVNASPCLITLRTDHVALRMCDGT
jgi:hypothetical protein